MNPGFKGDFVRLRMNFHNAKNLKLINIHFCMEIISTTVVVFNVAALTPKVYPLFTVERRIATLHSIYNKFSGVGDIST